MVNSVGKLAEFPGRVASSTFGPIQKLNAAIPARIRIAKTRSARKRFFMLVSPLSESTFKVKLLRCPRERMPDVKA